MKNAKHGITAGLLVLVLSLGFALVWAEETTAPNAPEDLRSQAQTLQSEGNYKDAYDLFSRLVLDAETKPELVPDDFSRAVQCLRSLNRVDEIDAFREKATARHKDNWRLLLAAAESIYGGNHYGFMIAGEFRRGRHRGGGQYANSFERDRVRALQWMQQALPLTREEDNTRDVGRFYLRLADMLLGNRGFAGAWQLQTLTDLSTLPDYEEGYYSRWNRGGSSRGAPVDADGNPVFYDRPGSWEKAANDGERWRWALFQAREYNPEFTSRVRKTFADFLRNQFGVQTMADYGAFFGRGGREDTGAPAETGTWELHTLKDTETIAKLATGVKRFELPEEFNFIRIYEEVAKHADSHGKEAMTTLCRIYENRRQYPKAAEMWKKNIEVFGDDPNRSKQQAYRQIVANWGEFEPVMTQPAGQGATVEYRFRNGNKVQLRAYEIKIEELLADVKKYIESQPQEWDWNRLNIERVGYRLVHESQEKYIGEEVASWELELEPRPAHFDRRITVSTPLQKGGAYLLTADMEAGNTSRIVLWLADLAIVQKPLEQKNWFFVGDADTGEPVVKANMECFGWRREQDRSDGRRRFHWKTRHFAEHTDDHGQIILGEDRMPSNFQWMFIARKDDKLAYMGFQGVWYRRMHDPQYNQVRTFVMTDRPVYRPDQTVHVKFWTNYARYDVEGPSAFADKTMHLLVRNPKGEKILEKSLVLDSYGGAAADLQLESQATLGVYSVQIREGGENGNWRGGGSFRVEEYKKPEFEVTVEAPDEPVALGETIKATIKAKYYFGAPVVNATVRYKVLRSEHSERWYPWRPWDWLFGEGYWWFAYDYTWYPGWSEWGVGRPHWPWMPWRPTPQPELVAENEVPIGPGGEVKVEIDTSLAKAVHGDRDHKYTITAEVVDQSRRTIVGEGNVLVSREPFKVFVWVDRGFYRKGDTLEAQVQARRLDGQGVDGRGVLKLLEISYDDETGKPVETQVQAWDLDTDEAGRASQKMTMRAGGQYRISYHLTDSKDHTIEGGYVVSVWGEGDGEADDFRFNAIELVPDRAEYNPGEKVQLRINTARRDSTVLLFLRPTNGVYLPPQTLKLDGRSVEEAIEVVKRDMPNFFIEALTVSGGKVHQTVRQIAVPPEKRILDVKVQPVKTEFKPGEKATLKLQLIDSNGEPFVGQAVVTIYDKAVEYISGGSNVQDIKEFFWKWTRSHRPSQATNLHRVTGNLLKKGQIPMRDIGVFGHSVADESGPEEEKLAKTLGEGFGLGGARANRKAGAMPMEAADAAPMPSAAPQAELAMADEAAAGEESVADKDDEGEMVQPTVRSQFADTAFWAAAVETGKDGFAEIEWTMPENLTTWKTRVWAMGEGTKVGDATTELITTKNLIVRLQAPRFFVQTDEVILSANVHNYLKDAKDAEVVLELEGGCLAFRDADQAETIERDGKTMSVHKTTVRVDANGETRVDWWVKAVEEGTAVVRMKALTDEESDAMEMTFPVKVHGMLKTESFSGVIRPDGEKVAFTLRVPEKRRPEASRLEVRYSPTLAGAMVDALPYLVDYPYGCTEQTLNRFLPTVIVQKTLLNMGVDLADVQKKMTNLNAQEIGDDQERAEDWKRIAGKGIGPDGKPIPRNPVWDMDEVTRMVKVGVERLTNMQNADGGWGWFYGPREHSWPHTTAVVVHGLQIARKNDVAIVPGVISKGIDWLKKYQQQELQKLLNYEMEKQDVPRKSHADNLDALVYMVLADEGVDNEDMRKRLYRDRNKLSLYGKSVFALACHKVGDQEKLDMLMKNIEQFLVQDDENQSAWLNMPESNRWWYWHGSEIETHAFYLKLLAKTEPKSRKASRLVKYLINNRRHATYWNSTRDTAYVIEAFADYIEASGEDKPDMTVEVVLDGKVAKTVTINAENLFTFDNKLVLTGEDVTAGEHTVELRRKGTGPLYANAYLTNFTLEDPITAAGLEIKVRRDYYKLVAVEKQVHVEGQRGQAVRQRVEKYERVKLDSLDEVTSGDMVEIELVLESKNDYEYILFEDIKAAGFEPVALRSGYGDNEMGAYMELRDDRVTFFVRRLARGKHSISYRMRAEIPGKFSALPTKASAMYAPELKANSNEFKVRIKDRPIEAEAAAEPDAAAEANPSAKSDSPAEVEEASNPKDTPQPDDAPKTVDKSEPQDALVPHASPVPQAIPEPIEQGTGCGE